MTISYHIHRFYPHIHYGHIHSRLVSLARGLSLQGPRHFDQEHVTWRRLARRC